jgi:hypothetical protein
MMNRAGIAETTGKVHHIDRICLAVRGKYNKIPGEVMLMNHAQNPPHLPGGITQIMEALEIIQALTIMDSSTEMYAEEGD